MAEVRDFASYADKLNNGNGRGKSDSGLSYKEKIRNHRLKVFARTVSVTVSAIIIISIIYIGWRDRRYDEAVISDIATITNGYDSKVLSLGSNIIQYSKDGVSCIDSSGQKVWNQTYEMQSPIARTCADVVAVGDYNGHSIYVSNSSGSLGEIDTNLPIRDFCVASQGVVAAVLDGTNVTWIYLYDAKGNTLANFKTTMRDSGYPIAVSLSPNGELLCVSYLFPEDGELKSRVAFFNFGSVGQNSIDNYVSGYDYPGVVVPYVQFMNGSASFAVSDDRLMFYYGDQKPMSQSDSFTGDEEIEAVYFNESYMGLVFPNSTSDGAYRLVVYNDHGENILTTYFDMEYSEIIFNNKQIIIYNEYNCRILDMDGNLKFEGDFTKPVTKMIPTGTRDKFTLVTSTVIQTMNLK